MEILEKLQKTTDLSENDLVIATYMIEHLEEIPRLSTREFAKRTYTSATSIIRFIKKLGYQNYNEFKYNIGSALKNLDLTNYKVVSNEDILSLINKTANLEKDSIDQMKELLKMDEIKELIELLTNSKYIDIIANDTNAKVGQYASHCLCNVGKIATVYHEVDKQLNFALNVSNDHVVFIMSKFSLNTYLLEMAKTLKRRNITTIAITGNRSNKLSDYCRYTIFTPFDPDMDRIGELVYFTAVKYVFDLFFSLIFSHDYQRMKQIEEFYNIIFFKRKQ